jgi:hypothetical protein
MKDYSDPTIWAEYLASQKKTEQIPPPPANFLSSLGNNPSEESIQGRLHRHCLMWEMREESTKTTQLLFDEGVLP